MTVAITGVHGRTYQIEGDNEACPDSIFVMGPDGLCIEFERGALLEALKSELGLYEPLAAGWEHALYVA